MNAVVIPFPSARRVAAMRYGKPAGDHVRDILRAGHSAAMALHEARQKFHGANQGKSFPKDAA